MKIFTHSLLVLFTAVSFTACNKTQVQKKVDNYFNNLDKTPTLKGIDANNDGIRDDIENIIEQFDENRQAKNSLRYLASEIQFRLGLPMETDEDALKAERLTSPAFDCFLDTDPFFKDGQKGLEDYVTLVNAATHNTELRLRHYSKYNRLLAGQVGHMYTGDCPNMNTNGKQNFPNIPF